MFTYVAIGRNNYNLQDAMNKFSQRFHWKIYVPTYNALEGYLNEVYSLKMSCQILCFF